MVCAVFSSPLILLVLLLDKFHGTTAHTVTIAFATQGPAVGLAGWSKLCLLMKQREHVSLFYLSYDVAIAPETCDGANATCIFGPGTSWTAGRNHLARSVALYEVKQAHHFKYWVFADHDLYTAQNCHVQSTCRALFAPFTIELSACCFDLAVELLRSPKVQYAAVNFVLWAAARSSPQYMGLAHLDCADAALVAFHRNAVPVLLPYVELVDRWTWWESQGIHFHLATGCLPGYSVYSNVFEITRTTTHSQYPRGRRITEATRAMQEVYGKRGLVPSVLSRIHVGLDQGNCLGWSDAQHGLQNMYEPLDPSPLHSSPSLIVSGHRWSSEAWQTLPVFLQCHQALRSRWQSYVETGDLTLTDGQRF